MDATHADDLCCSFICPFLYLVFQSSFRDRGNEPSVLLMFTQLEGTTTQSKSLYLAIVPHLTFQDWLESVFLDYYGLAVKY